MTSALTQVWVKQCCRPADAVVARLAMTLPVGKSADASVFVLVSMESVLYEVSTLLFTSRREPT